MLQKDQWMTIHVLIAQGLSQREIARRLGISRNTVARYAASDDVPRYKRRAPRPTKLEPFHDYILQRMAAAAPEQIAAPALLRELRELGYQGQLRSLQAFMSAHRPVPTPDPVVRFETPAGQQMQCDFVVFRRGNFYVSLASRLKQMGLSVDVETANTEVRKWLRDVANQ